MECMTIHIRKINDIIKNTTIFIKVKNLLNSYCILYLIKILFLLICDSLLY